MPGLHTEGDRPGEIRASAARGQRRVGVRLPSTVGAWGRGGPPPEAGREGPSGAGEEVRLMRYSAIEMIEKLVGFPTVSRDSNLEAHRVRAGLSRRARGGESPGTECRRDQGESLRLGRSARRGRGGALGAHGRRPGGRTAVGHRPVHAHRAGRAALRPRHLRHEELQRVRARPRARDGGGGPQTAHPLRPLLRRGGRLPGRAVDDRRAGRAPAAPRASSSASPRTCGSSTRTRGSAASRRW